MPREEINTHTFVFRFFVISTDTLQHYCQNFQELYIVKYTSREIIQSETEMRAENRVSVLEKFTKMNYLGKKESIYFNTTFINFVKPQQEVHCKSSKYQCL